MRLLGIQRIGHWSANFWEYLRSTLWFVPALIVIFAIVLAVALIQADASVQGMRLADRWPRVFGSSADGARELLSTIAGSMMTVVGVTFSITVVALVLAASQYTPRVLRNFMRDRSNQIVLGTFVGVFAYCLVVLRTIRGGESEFVPAIAVLGAVLLAIMAIGFLIYFIHHIAESIQASQIVRAAANETLHAVDRLFPTRLGAAPKGSDADAAQPPPALQPWTSVPAETSGYVQAIDMEALYALACERRLVLKMEKGVGEFVIEGLALALVGGIAPDRELFAELNSAYTIGHDRTVHQDPSFGIRQIVDVALKALSPGINDSTTAVNCVDFLGAILVRLATRHIESRFRADGDELRIIARSRNFESMLRGAFDEIRQNAEGNSAVLQRLVETLGVIAAQAGDDGRRRAVGRQIEWALEAAKRSLRAPHDRQPIEEAAEAALRAAAVLPKAYV